MVGRAWVGSSQSISVTCKTPSAPSWQPCAFSCTPEKSKTNQQTNTQTEKLSGNQCHYVQDVGSAQLCCFSVCNRHFIIFIITKITSPSAQHPTCFKGHVQILSFSCPFLFYTLMLTFLYTVKKTQWRYIDQIRDMPKIHLSTLLSFILLPSTLS